MGRISLMQIVMQIGFLLALWALPLGTALATQDGVEMMGKGEIRWNENVIRATGSGAPNADAANVAVARITAERTAEMDARRNILEVLKGVRIDSQTTMGSKMDSNDVISGKVSGIVRGARVVDKKYFSDGGVEVTIEMPIDASVLGVVLPMEKAGTQQGALQKEGTKFSSLVIDARGLGYAPSLSPALLDEKGEVIYDMTFVDATALEKDGLVDYVRSEEEMKNCKRKGENPLMIKAQGATEGNLSVDAASATQIAGSDQSYLQKGNVIIWID